MAGEKDPSMQQQEELLAEMEEEGRSVFEPPADQQRPEASTPDQLDQTFMSGEPKPDVI